MVMSDGKQTNPMNGAVVPSKSRWMSAALTLLSALLFVYVWRASAAPGHIGKLILAGTPVLALAGFTAPMMLRRELSPLGAKTALSRRISWDAMESVRIDSWRAGRRGLTSVRVRLAGEGRHWEAKLYSRSEAEQVRDALLAWLPADVRGRDAVATMCSVFEERRR